MGRKERAGPKVKVFKNEWLNNEVDDTPVREWCVADPSNPGTGRAKCLVCPRPKDKPAVTFSIGEGFTALRAQSNSKDKIHTKRIQEQDQNNEPNLFSQMYIQTAMRNQDEVNKKQRKLRNSCWSHTSSFLTLFTVTDCKQLFYLLQ